MKRVFTSLIAALALSAQLASADPSLEYQVKAVCVLNAARFVSWPASAFADSDAPLVIGILGDNPFGSILQDAVQGATVRQRRIVVRRVGLAEAANCHIVFVSRPERDRLPAIFQTIGDSSVLTISEIDRFVENGGTVGLALEHGKIRFEVKQEAASRARLKIESQFLLLARSTK
ncbi:MAG TPA: YfiR family protein [Chthoniobacterales bacterium]|nr:YfiR family protein [Chthoniobacterales bacterium]